MEIYYVNHLDEKVNLNAGPYRLLTTDIMDYEWDRLEENGRISGFTRGVIEKSIEIDIVPSGSKTSRQYANELTAVFEKDTASSICGRLYVGGYYLECFFCAVKNANWESGVIMTCSFTVVARSPRWIREETKSFFPYREDGAKSGSLDFDFDFDFDFASSQKGFEAWKTQHFADSEFKMTIYGPCSNPRILINSYPYGVNTQLDDREYLVIDSENRTVTKYLPDGSTQNLYNSRLKDKSIFKKIEAGEKLFSWDGNFGFDLTLFSERSAPEWN